jgi:predicted CopG family antitoxin
VVCINVTLITKFIVSYGRRDLEPSLTDIAPCSEKKVIYYTCTYTGKEDIVHKKLTITIDEQVYDGLYTVVGKGAISQFIEDLVRPHVVKDELDAAYKLMAEDKERETEALVWVEALIGDIEK